MEVSLKGRFELPPLIRLCSESAEALREPLIPSLESINFMMMKTIYLLVVVFIFLPRPLLAEERGAIFMIEETSLSGKQLAMIEVAVLELKKHDIDVLNYQLFLYKTGKSYLVVFDDPERARSQRGSSQNMLTFEVEIDSDLKILKSHFSR